MGFEDLEKQLVKLFIKAKTHRKQELKGRVKQKVMQAFCEKKERNTLPFWRSFLVPRSSLIAFGVVSVFVLFNIFPGQSFLLSAGKITSFEGPVKVVRNNNAILVRDSFKLKAGDLIHVGNKARAEMVFDGNLETTALSRTKLRVMSEGTLFLEEGELQSKALTGGEISTKRGFVQSSPGSAFRVSVSESNETRVISEENEIEVFDWKEGKTVLSAGEEVSLRSETTLFDHEIPEGLSLSIAQLNAIRAKMTISRTKLLTGVEKKIAGNWNGGKKDFLSAKKSFRSITQVLDASRDLAVGPRKKSLDTVSIREVNKTLAQKTDHQALLTEGASLETLFDIVERNKDRFGFGIAKTNVQSFDRFVLLEHIFDFATPEEKYALDVLQKKYTIAFLREIQNQEVKMEQIAKLNEKISLLPENDLSRNFLSQVQDLFAPDLAEMLDEKMRQVF